MKSWNNEEDMFSLMKEKLYTLVVGDILDVMGYTHQFLPQYIRPLKEHMKLAGKACTVLECDVFSPQKKPFGLPRLQGVYLLVYPVHRPFHAKTEPGALRHHYLAPCPFPAHAPTSRPRSQAIRIMASTTWSMVIAELSNITASSACFNGECSRFISR